ncbi:MAG: dihydroneopterin aldolase [Candidatus Dormibacteraceae bacterium]
MISGNETSDQLLTMVEVEEKTLDVLQLTGMVFYGRHGALPAERELGQRFTVDVELKADLSQARHSDLLGDTINYSHAYQIVQQVVEGEPCDLLEAVAQRIGQQLVKLERVEEATIRVHKRPPKPGEFHDFAVQITIEAKR